MREWRERFGWHAILRNRGEHSLYITLGLVLLGWTYDVTGTIRGVLLGLGLIVFLLNSRPLKRT